MTRDLAAATVRWKCLSLAALLLAIPEITRAQDVEQNKALARRFYESVWFSPHTEAVRELVAPEYIIHDVGGLDGAREGCRFPEGGKSIPRGCLHSCVDQSEPATHRQP